MTDLGRTTNHRGGVLCCSITAAGAALAGCLPFEHVHGALVSTVEKRWNDVDALVLIGATGIAVRAIAPLLGSKATDPAVVVVDDTGRYAVALTGGHAAGGNDLARSVAGLLGAEAVVTTATDRDGRPGLDDLGGLTASGPVAAVTRRWLDGAHLEVTVDAAVGTWPLPGALRRAMAEANDPGGVDDGRPPVHAVITDRADPPPGAVALRPPSLVVGVGSSTGADPARLEQLLAASLEAAGLSAASVGAFATLDRKADEPAIRALATTRALPLRTFAAVELSLVAVPTPSPVVASAVGTPSVAEAAALLAAGPGSTLVVTKQVISDATLAVARRAGPEGHLAVVGLGPGDPAHRTPAASAAVRHAEVVIGYGPYVDQAADLLGASQTVIRSPIGSERQRCMEAVSRASRGERVALVCSGDAGVYAMASLVFEMAGADGPPVEVVPGVTAATAAAAVLGAPLGHDHCSISLSDLLTPWEVIERRLRAAAEGDFVVSFYNPRSRTRRSQLSRALAILAAHRDGATPAAVVTDVGRPGQAVVRTTLHELRAEDVGMLSLVVVGSSITRWIGSSMVTPRGYLAEEGAADRTPTTAGGS